jgi:hypothetical protein
MRLHGLRTALTFAASATPEAAAGIRENHGCAVIRWHPNSENFGFIVGSIQKPNASVGR